MRRTHRHVRSAMALALAGTLLLGGPATAVELASSDGVEGDGGSVSALQSSTCYTYKRPEKRLARLTNRARTSRGLIKMKLDPELSRVARFHSKKMVMRGELFHQSAEQLNKRVTNWQTLAENVGKGPVILSIHRSFMKSEVHRTNILNPIKNHVGVGVVKKNGLKWVTVLFESALDPGTTLKMPDCS